MSERIILASGSPRRCDLLKMIGIDFEVCQCDVNETKIGAPNVVVQQNAFKKAKAAGLIHPNRLILAADTLVYSNNQSLGKPRDAADAFCMLQSLQGSWHEVYTGICISNGDISRAVTAYEMTRVQFIPLSNSEITDYIASAEPFGKAGSYAIQGIAGMFISRIEGSYSNVVGLPLHLVKALLPVAKSKIS